MTNATTLDQQTLRDKLSLEESLKEGYLGGRWHKHNSEGQMDYYFAFNPQGPVFSIKVLDDAFCEGINQKNVQIVYYPEHDFVGLLNRNITGLRESKPSQEYFKRRGYLCSIKSLMSYILLTPLREVLADPKNWFLEDRVDNDMIEVGKCMRTLDIVNRTVSGNLWEVLIKKVVRQIKNQLNRVDFSIL